MNDIDKNAPIHEQEERLEFRAEVQQLLHILAHSLYTEREIFLRELISNASDALHRVQFEMLTNREVLDPDAELAIRIDFDEAARTLMISDTGIGMTRDELIENLGTIAHSGAMRFLMSLEEGKRPTEIIGQFGVGFYAVFMVAEEVTVLTRSYRPGEQAWRWTSRGDSHFTLSPAEKRERGTTVIVKLREDATEFLSPWRVEQIVKRHSNYISFPIYVKGVVANQQTALWRKPLQEVAAEDYAAFYRQLTLDTEDPLCHIHLIADSPVHIRSLLFVPRRAERGPLRLRTEHGLQLYSRKVLIQERNAELLPEYLYFVEGVVDSDDVPLNISRESVQSSPVLRQIRKTLTGRILRELAQVAADRPQDYAVFWNEFGTWIKQGVITSPEDHDQLVPLLRFYSSKSDGAPISLDEYVSRMAADQNAVYYILGSDRVTVENSPHLDAFRTRGWEVLYLFDPIDGLLVQSLREYHGKRFQNVDDPDLELPRTETCEAESGPPLDDAYFTQVVKRAKQVLGERVTEVRESRILVDSPARLVSPGSGPERDLQRVRRLLEQDFELPPKILELNRHHPLIQNLARFTMNQPDNPLIDLTIEQLFDNLLLLDGLHPNPAQMVPRLQKLLEEALRHPKTDAQQ